MDAWIGTIGQNLQRIGNTDSRFLGMPVSIPGHDRQVGTERELMEVLPEASALASAFMYRQPAPLKSFKTTDRRLMSSNATDPAGGESLKSVRKRLHR